MAEAGPSPLPLELAGTRLRARLRALAAGWAVFPVAAFAFSRVSLMAFSWLGMQFIPSLQQGYRDEFFRQTPSLDGLFRWDCGYYLAIAVNGYLPSDLHTANIWPGLPMLARGVTWLSGLDLHLSLMLIANLAGLGALIAIYRVFMLIEDEAAARWGVLLFVAFPFHFYQASAYPESLMVFASALAFLLASRGHHVWAGLVLGAGSLSRHLTILFGLGLAAAQVKERGLSARKLLSPSLLGLLVPFLFPAGFMLFQHYRFEDALAFWHSRALWGTAAWLSALDVFSEGVPDVRHRVYLLFFAALLCSTLACFTRKQWLGLGFAALPLMLMLGASGVEGLGRYCASAWPAFLPLGVWLARRPAVQGPAVGALFLLQGLFFWLFAHQYPIL